MGIPRRDHRTRFKDVTATLVAVAGSDPSKTLITGRAGYTIFVQRIMVEVTTAAAQTWTFRDSAGTPVVLAVLPASAAVGDRHVLLESDEGIPCTEGKNLDLAAAAAGVAGSCIVEAYLKPTGTLTPDQI